MSRIVLLSNSQMRFPITRLLQPTLIPLAASRFTWKNADPAPTPMEATMLSEVGCVAIVGPMKDAQETNKDEAAFPKTVVASAIRLVEEEV